MISEKGADEQSCLTEMEFDIGASTACLIKKSPNKIRTNETEFFFVFNIHKNLYPDGEISQNPDSAHTSSVQRHVHGSKLDNHTTHSSVRDL